MQNYIAIVAHGLEQLVFDEIKALGGQNINIVFAGVTFEASTGINLNSSKRLEFCQCIKVMNNRLRLFIKEPKIMDLVG